MKKLGIVLAIAVALVLVGCASSGGGGSTEGASEPFTADLSTFSTVRNADPFTKNYDDLLIEFPKFPVDVTKYSRLTVRAKYFDGNNVEIKQGDGNAMLSLIYDLEGDWRGPESGPGPNTPMKEFNLGGYSGTASTDRGIRIRLTKVPGALLLQNSNVGVKFIELTEITFHD